MSQSKPYCKRCMLEDTSNYNGVLESYLKSLDDSVKTNQKEFEKRIALCDTCEHNLNGICRLCGCFVKARAAKKHMACPATPLKWESITE